MFATHSSIHPISHITWQICQALIIVEEEMELGSIMAVKLSIGMHGLPNERGSSLVYQAQWYTVYSLSISTPWDLELLLPHTY